LRVMPNIVNAAVKAKAWTFKAKAIGRQGHKISP